MNRLRTLRKKTIEGELYKRIPEIERHIQECYEITFDELCSQAEINNRSNPSYIPSEVLMYFLRETKNKNTDDQFNKLYQLLTSRIKSVLHLSGKSKSDAHLLNYQEFVLDDFAFRVISDRQEYYDKLDTFEVRFDAAIARRKYDAMRKMYRSDKPNEPLGNDEDGEISGEVERTLNELDPNINNTEDDFTYRLELQRAIDTLPEDERRVIIMSLEGIQIEKSTKSDIPSISELLKCSDKTVRNRKNRAVPKLQKILGTETKNDN